MTNFLSDEVCMKIEETKGYIVYSEFDKHDEAKKELLTQLGTVSPTKKIGVPVAKLQELYDNDLLNLMIDLPTPPESTSHKYGLEPLEQALYNDRVGLAGYDNKRVHEVYKTNVARDMLWEAQMIFIAWCLANEINPEKATFADYKRWLKEGECVEFDCNITGKHFEVHGTTDKWRGYIKEFVAYKRYFEKGDANA